MTIRRSRAQGLRSKSLRRQQRDQARHQTLRALQVETLEERRLMAANLELIGVQPNGDEFLENGDVRHTAPTNLRFVFSGNQSIDASSLGGIVVTRAGGDGAFGDASDIIIQPGYIGLGDSSNEVLLRFAQNLPDDEYRIDIKGTGSTPLRNTAGDAFRGGVDQQIEFRLDLGAQVIAVVPQPMETVNGTLVQHRDQIQVYFNDDDLYVPDAENPALYQLIYTDDTANNTDDVVFTPVSVSYDPGADMAILTFEDAIHLLIDPNSGNPIGAGTFRLRIGTDEQTPLVPDEIDPRKGTDELAPVEDVGSSFSSAWDLGMLDGQSQLISSRIDAQTYLLDFPGGNDEPGHREIPEETAGGYDNHVNPLFGADSTPGITTILYNFQANYGLDDQGLPLKNLITSTQKERAREAFEVWGEYIGVQFLETTDQGLTIVTGDPHALDPFAPDVVNHALSKPDVNAHFMVRVDPDYENGLLILDNAFQWNDDFGADWYETTMIGIGFMLGLERATDLPSSTLMAFASDFSFPGSTASEPIFPGNQDIVHGSYLHRPDSNDIDMYRFEIAVGEEGVFTAETFAERQPNSSLLDSILILYRENADGTRTIIARNDDYYSEDSYINLRLSAGTYYLGVTASGNDLYNPEFEDTGFGGKSQGPYDLRVEFRRDAVAGEAMRDVTEAGTAGTTLDGDADGSPGGVSNFWFRAVTPGKTILVDKLNRPFEAGIKGRYQTISSALAASAPGDVIRILGNGGSDNNILTLADNYAYEIGPGPLPNQILADGKTLDVPRGVTIMVDAGAIFKMNQSRIGVGSSSLSVDRSAGAFQVLGTPDLPVYFTSYFDETTGLDTYLPTTEPRPGHWGGIVFRSDFDNAEERFNYEREGIFLNYVNHADVRYGGGNVTIDSVRQIVTPVHMTESRPTITYNQITLSADAPLSADPDSFEETNFHSPEYQLKGHFTSDYQRVGPDLYGNLLLDNSSNGLFVRITTPAGDSQKGLTVPGRFDDTDVVHILADNLQIEGTSGEPILELARPPVNLVTAAPRTGGQMASGEYYYKIVYVDANGFEGRPSEATVKVTLSGANRSVKLDKLPAATGDFTARRIYRSTSGVAGPYVFVDQINTSDVTYTDTRSLAQLDPNNTLQRDVPTVQGLTLTAVVGGTGTLSAGSYKYRITFVNSSDGSESPSSDPSATRILSGDGQINLANITRPATSGEYADYDVIRIYRSESDGKGPYHLAGEISATDSVFEDLGADLGTTLSPELYGVARARTDARLAIDPGIVVKLEGSRIETTFGAQLIAEGTAGREVIFTSRSDDRYGAGGTFDTNGDGARAIPKLGDWGGIYVGVLGTASLDHTLLTFGGGVTKIEGTFKAFNVLEIHQADVRVANSVIEYNANGQAGQGPADRFGRGYNEPATIYVRGAQPIFVNNTIQHNDEVAISINANSFTSEPLPDLGRSTGLIARTGNYSDNIGPLIRGNLMIDNPINAIDIRGEVLTTQSVWDDTDIVHVLRGEQVIVPDFHTDIGLRLQSSPSASLVVKMEGAGDSFDPSLGAGFTATGRRLDIDDRIGGTMQIIGQPDFPVILTSLSDDTVGAGYQPDGQTLTDTNNNGWDTLPQAGDWRSVRFEQFANDRNVELILETESPASATSGDNSTPATAQNIGDLAPSEFAGDDNLRLGFDIRGVLNQRSDVDVYSFDAQAGTEIWLDIDRTATTLNSVIELIDSAETIIARSDDSLAETLDPSLLYRSPTIDATTVNPLQKLADEYQPHNASELPKDFYSLNVYDAGLRIVLPGVVGVRSTYHVRVRSSSNDLDNLSGGLTTGSYQLQVRLRETDEVAGVTVRYADVRYATNGIELYGLPGHSPLLGEVAEDEEVGGPETNNQVFPGSTPGAGPQDIGNLLLSDRSVISIAGKINTLDDIDFYEMQVAYEATAGSLFQHASVVLDVDYASGLSRADTIVSVFDSFGRLVLIGRNSNIADDRGGALDEGDLTDLSRGSLGALDPYIGPVELPEATYFVAVTSNARIPTQLLTNPDVRLEPINTVTRVVEDHIGSSGGSTAADPQVPVLLDENSAIAASPDDLLILILHDEGNPDEVLLSSAQLTTGVVNSTIGPYPGKVNDLATRGNGNTYTFTTPDEDPAPSDSTVGILRGVNTSSPQYIASRDDGILTYQQHPTTPGVAIPSDVGIEFHAMAYGVIDGQERLLAVGSRGDADTRPAGPTRFTNLLYQFDPDTGKAISAPQADRTGNARMQGAGTQIVERGQLNTNTGGGPGGLIVGLSVYDGKLYALTDTGGLFLVLNPLSNNATLQYIDDIVPNAGTIQEAETNDSMADAQNLDTEVWTQRFDANIGDMVQDTSTTIKHITIEGTGDDGYLGEFISSGSGGLNVPTGAVFSPVDGNYYVASSASNEILRYNGLTGAFIDTFVTAGDGGLTQPEGIALGPDGDGDGFPELFVASRLTDQILRYDGATGAFLDVFAASPMPWQPAGIAFGPDASGDGSPELYVSGYLWDNVIELDGVSGGYRRELVPSGRGGLTGPVGLSFESDGRLYVASSNDDSILRYDAATGAFVDDMVVTALGGLDQPQYFVIGPDANGDGDGELYVSSFGTDSVMRYNARTGAFVDEYVFANNGGLDAPTSLAFHADGSLLVTSSATSSVLKFDTAGTPTFDYFTFTVENDGDRGIFDLDFGYLAGDSGSFDGELFVFDSTGVLLAANNDASVRFGRGGSDNSRDPYLEVIFPEAGQYYVVVGEFDSDFADATAGTGNRADLTDTYSLQISIENYKGSSLEGLAVSMRPDVSSEGVFLAINNQGDLFAFSTDNTSIDSVPFFAGGASRISTGIHDVLGIALTTTNLWHMSDARRDDEGHGLTNIFDDSRGSASVVREREPNNTPATAHDLELESWSLGYDSNIGDTQDPPVNTSTTIPHITIKGSGDGTYDFYSFEVTTAGARGIFDIDMDFDEQLDPHGFMDSEVLLLDEYGNVITWLEDAALPTDGDGGKEFLFDPVLEPCLEYIFPAAGTYMVAVTKYVAPFIWQPPEEGDFYTLQISIENHPVDAPKADAGLSYFFGPELTGVVTDALAGEPVTIVSPGHGLLGGERVDVQGILGIPGANGTFTVNVVDDDTFELADSEATGAYQGGGIWRLLQIPEGVQGTIKTYPFSLLGYSAEDLPMLYFNYLLDGDPSLSLDMASVSIEDSNGVIHPVVAKGDGLVNSTGGATPQWRQARIDLGQFANRDQLRLIFSFDSGDTVASSFEGWLIDDIIIGFAERGEMVSYAYNDPTFIINPDSKTTDALTGPYQLEIRTASDPGMSQRPTEEHPNSLQLTKTWDTNERLAQQASIVAPAAADIVDGQTFTISDGIKTLTFEFDNDDTVQEGNVRIAYEDGDTALQMSEYIRDAINNEDVQSAIDITATISAASLTGTNFADGTTPTEPTYQMVNLAGTAIVAGIQHVMYDGFGDVNRFRDQGQVIIHSNFITDSRDFGIVADAGARDVEPRLAVGFLEAHAGAARNLRELNNAPDGGLAPGAVIENNVISNEGLGGIHVSGNIAPFEVVPPTDTDDFYSGEFICDGQTFTIHAYRTDVTFEFEDISGGSSICGSGVAGGDGWNEGNIPIFYRQSGNNYLSPPWVIPPRPYNQVEMATAIRDAIQSSILVTNGTTLHVNATLEVSRYLRSAIVPDNALYGPPLVSVYLENVSAIDIPTSLALDTRRDDDGNEIPLPLGAAVQPFYRVLNNTIYGNDGTQSFYPGTGTAEPNDRISSAVETWQGRQHNPEYFSDDAVIGDGIELLNDVSLDVDFYRFELQIGERVTIDIDTTVSSTLNSYLRLFDASGNEVSSNDDGTGPGETGGPDAFIDYTATTAGTYYVAVSGKGNSVYDPLSLGNRMGPASVGSYHIDINVLAPRTWVITAQDGTQFTDGQTFTVSDINGSVTYEFDDVNAPGVTTGNIAIVYDSRVVEPAGFNHRGPGYRAPEMAVAMAQTIGEGLTGVTAIALGGFAGASGDFPPQTPAISGDTSFYGFPGFGHDNPYTPPETSGELYVVVKGATRITGDVLFQPMLDENIDQLLPETGILISDRSSPTLLNNVLSNLNAGIWQDASPTSVVGGSIYQHNDQADSNIGSTNDDFNVHLGNYDPLFLNAADGNFYPAPLSPIIDSAIDSLEDRSRYAIIKDAIGIPVSPILAPDLDAAGLLRSDDPEVETPSGQGANVFKDRGGLDRADFAGPDAILIVPQDNDAAGVDIDPTVTIVHLSEGVYDNFTIQLVDGLQTSNAGEGVGVADLTVDSTNVTVTADGQLLIENVDYAFQYNATTNTIRLTPLAGAWANDKAYVITLPNQDRFVIDMPHGGQVSDGETFVITDESGGTVTFEFESGYSLFVPETLKLYVPAVGKGPGGIQDGQRFTVSTGTIQYIFEYDANTPPNYLPGNTPINIASISTQDEVALATVNALIARNIGVTPVYLGNGVIHFGARDTYSVNTSLSTLTQSGRPGVVADGNTIVIADGVHPTRTLEFDSNGSVAAGRTAIPFTAASTQDDIAQTIAATITSIGYGLAPVYYGDGHVHIGGGTNHRVVVSGSPKLSLQGQPGVRTSTTLIVPPQAAGVGGIADGQWFSIQNGSSAPVVFEFDRNGSVSPGSVPILFTPTSTVDQLASYIISAIDLADVGLAPTYTGAGYIALHDTIHHKTDTLNTKISQFGVPGGVVQVDFLPDATFTAKDFAPLILDAINNSLLTDVTTTYRGGTSYYINGIKSISGLQNFFISSIKDNAGNSLQPNQSSNQTYFTILMPGVQFDFGDAPDSYGTMFADNGARHVISDNPILLGTGVTTEPDGLASPDADSDDDDGVDLSEAVFNQYIATQITLTASDYGFVDAWIDYNQDGDWNDPAEQVLVSQPVVEGTNDLVIQTISTAPAGDTYLRFRISRLGGLTPYGVATDGEVEDYLIRIEDGMPPVAVDDSGLITDEVTPLVIDPAILLANDTDADTPHDQLSVGRFTATSMLGATITWDGSSIVYDPTTSEVLQTLVPGEQMVDSFDYQASDGVLPSNWATVTVVVIGLNNAPVAVDDLYATNEDSTLNIPAAGVLSNDSDPDVNDSIAVSGYDAVSSMGAAITMNADGSFLYDPTQAAAIQALAQDALANDTFTYTVTDTGGLTSTATVTVELTGVNDAPTAVEDGYATDEDTPRTVTAPGLLENDWDIDGNPVSVVAGNLTSVWGASVVLLSDGSLVYDPTGAAALQALAEGDSIEDSFTYTVIDSLGLTHSATVTMTVDGVNDAPVAVDDTYATDEDQVLNIGPDGVLTNDHDLEGSALFVDVTLTDTTSLLGATVVALADGSFAYDPTGAALIRALAPGDTAIDMFSYTVIDDLGAASSATVRVHITGVNTAPVTVDKTFATDEDSILDVAAPGVLTDNYDPDGQAIEVLDYETTSTLGATVVVHADGSFSYDPTTSLVLQTMNVGLMLTDAFHYTIVDDDVNAKTAIGTIYVDVTGLNDAPVAANDSLTVPRGVESILSVLNNDSDVDGLLDTSSVVVQSQPTHGTAAVLADGTIQYTPAANYSGSDTLTYTVLDNSGTVSNVATVTLQVNAAPVANNDSVQTFRNVPVTISVLANDQDVDGTLVPSTVTLVTQPQHGVAAVTANGRVVYTPSSGFTGNDSFTYTVRDNLGVVSNVGTVSIAVIVDPFPWQNPMNQYDVNNDGSVSPIDVLLVISDLNRGGSRDLPNPPVAPNVPPPYVDVSGDNKISPVDALMIITYLNTGHGEGEGEGEGEAVLGSRLMMSDVGSSLVASSLLPTGFVLPSSPSQTAPSDPRAAQARVSAGIANTASAASTLPFGNAEAVRQAALAGFLASSRWEESLEDLVPSPDNSSDQDRPEDQALLELLYGRGGLN